MTSLENVANHLPTALRSGLVIFRGVRPPIHQGEIQAAGRGLGKMNPGA